MVSRSGQKLFRSGDVRNVTKRKCLLLLFCCEHFVQEFKRFFRKLVSKEIENSSIYLKVNCYANGFQ